METVTLTGPWHLVAQFVGVLLLAGFVLGWVVGWFQGFHRGVRGPANGEILPPRGGSVMGLPGPTRSVFSKPTVGPKGGTGVPPKPCDCGR